MDSEGPQILLYSDYACPFCFLFNASVEALEGEFEVEVHWRAFELRPEGSPLPPRDGPYLQGAWRQAFLLAEQWGVTLRRPSRRPRTRMALEAAEFAAERGVFREYNTRVFEAFFLHDLDIGSPRVLADLGAQVGLSSREILSHLEAGAYAARVDDSRRAGDNDGVDGVPTLLMGSERVEGAQPYSVVRDAYVRSRGQG